MRKQMIAIITCVMLLLCSVMTCASAENTLPDLVDTVSTLLFNTSNVTIRGCRIKETLNNSTISS